MSSLNFTFIGHAFATGLLVWFAALGLIITLRVLKGDIRSLGMLQNDESDNSAKPERVAAMATFATVIIGYAMMALQADVVAHPSLPDVPQTLISLLTGGNAVYLAGKVARGT